MNKVRTLIKKILKVVLWVIISFVLLLILIIGLIQMPFIQNKIVHFATTFVSNKTHTRIEIKKVSLSLLGSVSVQGLFMEDLNKDTLLYVGKLKTRIGLSSLLHRKIDVKNFELNDVYLNVNRPENDSLFNFNFLITAFSDTSKQITPEKDTTAAAWTFAVNKLRLENIHLRFDDEYGGMNGALDLKRIELKMNEIDIVNLIFDVDDLDVESLNGHFVMTKPTTPSEKESESVLPTIRASSIKINNSMFSYGDSINKMQIAALINHFDLKHGELDLEKQGVTVDYVGLSESKIQFNTENADTLTDASDTIDNKVAEENNWTVSVKSIELNENSFAYNVSNKPIIGNYFDVNHMVYNHIKLSATDLFYSPLETKVSVHEFAAIDRNNFSVTGFKTDFAMTPHAISAAGLMLTTSNSSINADIKIEFSSLENLGDSLSSMRLDLDMKKVSIGTADVVYFSSGLKEMVFFDKIKNTTHISGRVNGPINHLTGENLSIKTGSKTILKTDFQITGLPDVQNTYFDFPNLSIISGKQDIEMMLGASIPQSIDLPRNVDFQIVFKGKIKAFKSGILMNSNYGSVKIQAQIDEQENFTSTINIPMFNLGPLLKDTIFFGPVSLTAEASGQGLDIETLNALFKAEVTKLYLNEYTYQNLNLDGRISGQEFEIKANLNDENADFDLEGLVDLNPNYECYKFSLNVAGVDLKKLNFTEEDLRLSFIAEADLKGDTVNLLNGNVRLSKLVIAKEDEKYVLDSVLFASINEPNFNGQNMPNVLLGIIYNGTIAPADITANLNDFANTYFPFSDSSKLKEEVMPAHFDFEIQLRNHPSITQVFLPELKEFEKGIISGSFDSRKNDLILNATIKKITYGTIEITDLILDVSSTPTALNYELSSSDVSSSQIKLDNFLFAGKIADETIFANLSSIDDSLNKKLEIRSQITKDETHYKFALEPSGFFLMNRQWDVASDNYILFGEEGILIHHFFLNNAESQLNIASINNQFNDDLNIEIRNFKLDDISKIIEKDTSLIKGNVDGNVLLKRVDDAYGLIADITISNLYVLDAPLGDLSVKAENPTVGKFDIDVSLSGAGNNMSMSGFYIPKGGENSLNIETTIQSLSMKTVEAFSMGQITEASGNITGDFLIQGAVNAPEVTGKLVFNDVKIKPALLNTGLELKNETIHFSTDDISFDSFTLLDAEQHKIVIDGAIQMKAFKDFVFALKVNSTDFLLMSTSVADNEAYFGTLIVDSEIDINGPVTLPVINAKVKIKKGSSFTFVVPEEKLSSNLREDVVLFEDTLTFHAILNRDNDKISQTSSLTGIDLTTIIEIDREATLCLLMDPTSNDSLVVRGEAALSFSMDRSGKMSLTGAYNIDEGSYLVSLESVVKREFDILPGSTIIWNGEILDADISINTKYTVRTAPYELVAYQISSLSDAESGAYKQRYPFWVLLKLRGQIMQPEISFEIQLPPEDKGILGGLVNQKLNMLNEDVSALNKQVFALLILGRFIQENPLSTETSGASSVVRTTVGKFLSAQLNQLSSKVVPGVELNVDIQSYDDYQSGQAEGRTEVEIGIKKQLFNERISVQIGGSVDVEGEQTKQNSSSDITGDVQIEYKLTKDGRFRLKGFRHNQYEGAIEGQLVETGIGILFVRNFNKWKDIFKKDKPENDSTDINNQQ